MAPVTITNSIPVSDFPNFDVVAGDPQNHYYFSNSKLATTANAASATFQKKVMQEWRILSSSLPETIFVRVYESRISLLRAAIVGAQGTPYHDGLFFFDIFLPDDYPSSPPLVSYRSFGFRINPNIYEIGIVCLSLLNTWSGQPSEKWDPNQSTILQVLLSIQALVLNEKPYLNDPEYAFSKGNKVWVKKSTGYSEEVFVLCCKSALCLLRNPPANFEVLVTSHFRERGEAILSACNAYRSGLVRVGGKVPVSGVCKKISVPLSRFKGMIDDVYGDLVRAFSNAGAPVDQFVKQLEQFAKQLEAKALEAQRREDEKRKERERKKEAREAMKKKVVAMVEKIWVGLGFKNRSICDDQVGVKVVI